MQSFIVRIWREGENPESQPAWRGSIDQVDSGKRFYFLSIEGIVQFLERQLSTSIKPAPKAWRRFIGTSRARGRSRG